MPKQKLIDNKKKCAKDQLWFLKLGIIFFYY